AKHTFGAVCALTSPPTGFPTCGIYAQACLAGAPVRPREEPRMDQTVQTRSSVPVRGIGEDDCAELFHRWCHHRDRRARDELVQRFLPLARKLAHRYRGAHEPIE